MFLGIDTGVLIGGSTDRSVIVIVSPLSRRGARVVDLTGNGTSSSSSNGSVSQPHVVDLTRDPLHTTHTLPNKSVLNTVKPSLKTRRLK